MPVVHPGNIEPHGTVVPLTHAQPSLRAPLQFSSTRIAQADYGMAEIAYELNLSGAQLAREAARTAQNEDGRARFVAGAIGPTNRTASISPDVLNPSFR